MRQPFSLEQQVADQISTSEDMMKDRYISDMTQTGTKQMESLVKKMHKKELAYLKVDLANFLKQD